MLFIIPIAATPSLAQVTESVKLPLAGLVSYWPAEGTADDVTGHNNGILVGGVSFPRGISGKSFSLDGADDYIFIPDSPTLNFGVHDFSISLWMRTAFSNSGVGTDFLLSKVASGPSQEYSLQYNSDIDDKALFSVGDGVGGQYVSGGPKLGDNRWHHVVGLRMGTEIRLYVDCRLAARGGCFGSGCSVVNSTGPNNVVIGGRQNPANDPFFDGRIDEVAIYSRALSDAEIATIFRITSGRTCS